MIDLGGQPPLPEAERPLARTGSAADHPPARKRRQRAPAATASNLHRFGSQTDVVNARAKGVHHWLEAFLAMAGGALAVQQRLPKSCRFAVSVS